MWSVAGSADGSAPGDAGSSASGGGGIDTCADGGTTYVPADEDSGGGY